MYVTQVGTAPPRLAFFTNIERDIPAHYVRFLEGRFRTELGLEGSGSPIRFEFRRTGRSWAESRSSESRSKEDKGGKGRGAGTPRRAPAAS
jgi:hypothetical protein